jgi:PKD repeat protein
MIYVQGWGPREIRVTGLRTTPDPHRDALRREGTVFARISGAVVAVTRRRVLLGCLAAAGAVVFWSAQATAAQAAPGDIGFEGPSMVGSGGGATGDKPESKLWWNDGFWWASMWSRSAGDYHIFRLNTANQSWIDTGTVLDDRANTRADTLWDAGTNKLYVASHLFSTGSSSGSPARLYRYSYEAATDTYSLDAGFPVQIGNYRTEALTIAKDSTGQLWATWKQGTTFVVNASVCNPGCNDAAWGTPFTPTVAGTKTTFNSDDVSAVIAFAGKVGVFWTNQTNGTDYLAVHDDSSPDTTWSGEIALSGPGLADDHVNLKTDSSGRVYAVVKTSREGLTDPLVVLLVRSTSGSWTSTTVGRKQDGHTRPIVELDEDSQRIHVFATSPESGGSIYEKTSPMSSIAFAPGKGTLVIKNADGELNNATSTKQNVSPATGLVVLASGQQVYFHQYFSLGGGGGTAPTAAFSASPTSGAAPLSVQFTDTSTGGPTAWEWDFQNDGTIDSTQQNPSFVYTAPGTYSVKLTVSNTSGSSSMTKAAYIAVSAVGSTLTFTPSDDAFVRSNRPDEVTGALTDLRSWKGTGQTNSFLKFTVSGITGTVTSAKLRLYVVDASPKAGDLYPVADTTWSEGTITWSTAPQIGATGIAPGGAAPLGTWIEISLGTVIGGDGTYSFALVGTSSDAAWFSSKEGANSPQLVLTQS